MTVGDEVEGVKREAESQAVETKKQKKAVETSEPESEAKPAAAVSLNSVLVNTKDYIVEPYYFLHMPVLVREFQIGLKGVLSYGILKVKKNK